MKVLPGPEGKDTSLQWEEIVHEHVHRNEEQQAEAGSVFPSFILLSFSTFETLLLLLHSERSSLRLTDPTRSAGAASPKQPSISVSISPPPPPPLQEECKHAFFFFLILHIFAVFHLHAHLHPLAASDPSRARVPGAFTAARAFRKQTFVSLNTPNLVSV